MLGQSNNDTWHGTLSGYIYHKCRCSACKAVRSACGKEYYKKNTEKVAARARKYQKEHPEKEAARGRKYREEHPEKAVVRQRKYREKHAAKLKVSNRKYREEHPDYHRQYSKINAVKYAAASRKYHKTERGKQANRANLSRRRARKMNAAGFCTREQLEARIAFYGWLCWMCRGPYEAIDHVKPLVRGGPNWPANLRPACKSCNSSKGAKYDSKKPLAESIRLCQKML